ncbi:MAG: hypothetical protein GX957_14875 [Clostridiaceae bacterium]|nr:hypothetical protein [Clostridiaceae bacterium]
MTITLYVIALITLGDFLSMEKANPCSLKIVGGISVGDGLVSKRHKVSA